jgi:hypothetical protein
MGLLLINQEVEGLLTSAAGKSVLANSAYTVLLKQKPAVIKNISRTFHLSKFEQDYLLSASVGEGILIIDDEHLELKVIASGDEYDVITTKGDDLLKINGNSETEGEQKDVNITVDPENNFHKLGKMKKADKEFLLGEGYKIRTYKGIDGKKKKYVIKTRFNESDQHCMLTYDLYHQIQKFSKKVWLYQTTKPDVVFEVDGVTYAIEVETGKINNKKILKEKVGELKKNYGENWFFVVTDRNKVSHYKKYGPCYRKENVGKKLAEFSTTNSKGRKLKT